MQVIIKCEDKDEFKSIVDELTAREFSILETRTPGYFSNEKPVSTPEYLPFVVMLFGIILGVTFVILINSVWFHQVGDKPQNLSGVKGWLPVIFEITVLFTAIFYLIRFIMGISKKSQETSVLIEPMHYYCFLELNNEYEKEHVFAHFKKHQIIVC